MIRNKLKSTPIKKGSVIALFILILPFVYWLTEKFMPDNYSTIEVRYNTINPVIPTLKMGNDMQSKIEIIPNRIDTSENVITAQFKIPYFKHINHYLIQYENATAVNIYGLRLYSRFLSKNLSGHSMATYIRTGCDIKLINQQVQLLPNKQQPSVKIQFNAYKTFQLFFFIKTLILSIIVSFIISLLINKFSNNGLKNQAVQKQFIVALFISLIFTPILVDYNIFPINEKRHLAKKPKFHLKNIINYHREYGLYFTDNFSFRNQCILLKNIVYDQFLKTSPIPHNVLFGKDGWLFNTENKAIECYQNKELLSDIQLKKIASTLEIQKKWLDKRNIKFYLLITPSKPRIYNEYLPDKLQIQVNKQSKAEQLSAFLKANTSIKPILPNKALINAKGNMPLFYKTDLHWTRYGALIGYNVLMEEIRKDFPTIKQQDISRFDYIESGFYGDLGTMLNIPKHLLSTEYVPTQKHPSKSWLNDIRKQYTNELFLSIPIQTENADSTLPKAVFFRDSYSNFYLNYAMNDFNKCTFFWTYYLIPEFIMEEQPDIVVLEIMEIFIDKLLNSDKYYTFVDNKIKP